MRWTKLKRLCDQKRGPEMEVIYDNAHTMTMTGETVTNYTFIEEGNATRNGWCSMRLVIIEHVSNPQDPAQRSSRFTRYDPAIHDNGSHYMSHLWKARRYWNVSFNEYRYSLKNPFGATIDIPLRPVRN
jgi:hypothetical protein